jgi:hypothetical protein
MKTQTVDLARIFDFENRVTGGGIRTLSASGGSNDHDADYSEKLKLLRKFISENKRPKKTDGMLFADNELLNLPFETMKALYANTVSETSPDPSHKTGEDSQDEIAVSRQSVIEGTRQKSGAIKPLSVCFTEENKRNRQERPGQQFE